MNEYSSTLTPVKKRELTSHLPIIDINMSREMTKPTNSCAPREDSGQPGHPPSLFRDFAVRMKKAWVLSYPLSAHRRL